MHTNCQDTLAAAGAEYGFTPHDVHDSFNLWMTVDVEADGHWDIGWNQAPSSHQAPRLHGHRGVLRHPRRRRHRPGGWDQR